MCITVSVMAQDTTICIKSGDSTICVPTYKHVVFKTVNKIDLLQSFNFKGTKLLCNLHNGVMYYQLISDRGLKTFQFILKTKESIYIFKVDNFVIRMEEIKR